MMVVILVSLVVAGTWYGYSYAKHAANSTPDITKYID